MIIYIVKNDRDEEVAAYTDQQHARVFVEQFEEATFRQYNVEELVCDISTEGASVA